MTVFLFFVCALAQYDDDDDDSFGQSPFGQDQGNDKRNADATGYNADAEALSNLDDLSNLIPSADGDDGWDKELDFDTFFDQDSTKKSCGEDLKMCKHALTTMHCLASNRDKLTFSCMVEIEQYLPDTCAIEVDRHGCDGLETPVVPCLKDHLDALSNDCSNVVLISEGIIAMRATLPPTATGRSQPNSTLRTAPKEFTGCSLDLIEATQLDRCCTYDLAAIQSRCMFGSSIENCAEQMCESTGNGQMNKYVKGAGQTDVQNQWGFRCCPQSDEPTISSPLQWPTGFQWMTTYSKLQVALISMSVSITILFALALGVPKVEAILQAKDLLLNYKGEEKYGACDLSLPTVCRH